MSLFITGLAFNDDMQADPVKVGILLASVTAAAVGSAMFIALAEAAKRRTMAPEPVAVAAQRRGAITTAWEHTA